VNAVENQKIEKVHHAENKQNQADLPRERLDSGARRFDVIADLQSEANITQIYQIKADDKKMIDRIGKTFIAVKNLDQKDPTVFMKRLRDPDR
jgi:hypothetical protein